MSLTINTNYQSLIGQRNLTKSQSALGTAIQRLSSGLRINSAKDDAAGEAIANRLTAQLNGLDQAARNANDGISLAQTTEGALNEINNDLQRIRELTVHSLNGTNSASDIASIQTEIAQRLDEIDRISQQASFNGINVLSSDQTVSIQVGANAGDSIDIQLSEINTTTLGLDDFTPQVSTSVIANVINPGPRLSVDLTSFVNATNILPTQGFSLIDMKRDAISGQYYIEVNYQDGSVGYFKAAVDDSNPSAIVVKSVDQTSTAITNPAGAPTTGTNTLVYDSTNDQYYIKSVGTAGEINYYAATATKNTNTSVVTVANVSATAATPDKTVTADPLSDLDKAIAQVDSLRSNLGAIQNRLESAISVVSNTGINLEAARSRIEDADYAVEASNMTKEQILQQAGTSVLAQSNQEQQNILSLLR